MPKRLVPLTFSLISGIDVLTRSARANRSPERRYGCREGGCREAREMEQHAAGKIRVRWETISSGAAP